MALYIQQNLSDDSIQLELEYTTNTFIMMLDDEVIIGYAKLSESIVPKALQPLTALQISRIYIAKKYIGKGIGKQLMQMSIQLAKENNKQIIWLGVWEKNEHAINFYQHGGFEKFEEEIFVLGKDEQTDWLMKKQL
ncbi:MAG: GNAT family N-acetyltransferase [Pedobacter sp.]|nr:GNAT family N-acetyltransferase [Chitinophagaceae bacterium]